MCNSWPRGGRRLPKERYCVVSARVADAASGRRGPGGGWFGVQ
jgi:hypothetical protein